MANKPSINDRLAGKGRSFVAAAIQPSAGAGEERDQAVETQEPRKPESQDAKPTRTTRSAAAEKHTLNPQAGKPKLALAKATFGIRPDQMTLLEEIRVEARKRGEKPPSKYDLAVEAFDLLARKYERK